MGQVDYLKIISKYQQKVEKSGGKMGQIADDMSEGACCSGCGMYFEDDHGFPVLCFDCWANTSEQECRKIQRATKKLIGG